MKKAFTFVLAMVIALLSAACSGGGGSTAESSQQSVPPSTASVASESSKAASDAEFVITESMFGNPNGSIELTWEPNNAHWISTENAQKVEYLKARAEEWCKKNPDVKVTISAAPATTNEMMAKAMVAAVAGQSPDIVTIDAYLFPQFHQFATPITDLLDQYHVKIDDFFPFCQEVMVKDGEVLGLYYTTDVRTMFYRKDLIPEAPKTWDDVIEVGKQLKGQGFETPYFFTAGLSDSTMMCTLLPYFWGQGGELFDENGEAAVGTEPNKTYMTNVYQFMKQLLDEGIASERTLTYTTDADLLPEITSGSAAMFISGNYMISQVRSAIGDEAFDQQWGAAMIPMKNEGEHTVSSGGWAESIFTKDEAKRKLGTDLVMHMYVGDEGMAGWCEAGGYLPTRKPVFDGAEFFNSNPYMQFFKEELDFSKARPANDGYQALSDELQVAMAEVMTGTLDPAAAVDKAVEAYKNA